MTTLLPSRLAGCLELRPSTHRDERGSFVKPFQASTFESLGLESRWGEIFYSVSGRGVIRGLHLQVPPAAQAKLVSCVVGEILDVVVDVRVGSPTFGEHDAFRLTGGEMAAVYVAEGFAHGFAALTEPAVVAYAVTNEHDPACDTGVRWDSVPGLLWPVEAPIISARDAALPTLDAFASPFSFGGGGG